MAHAMSEGQSLDVEIPKELVDFETVLSRVKLFMEENNCIGDGSTLSLHHLPSEVTDAVSCAQHQIEALQDLENPNEDDEDALDDGFFICDLNVVFQKLLAWRQLFPRVKPFYALKCNPDPMVAAILGAATGRTTADDDINDNGSGGAGAAGFDCASIPEIEMAKDVQRQYGSNNNNKNQLRDNVVYANPQRAENDLEKALLKYSVRVLTFDGPEELYKVHRIYQQELQRQKDDDDAATIEIPLLVLRILVPDEHSSVPLGEKFGVPPDDVPALVKLAVELKLPIIGVSFHGGSGNHHPESYVEAIELAYQAMLSIDQIQTPLNLPPCWLCDIGGGFPGNDGIGAGQGRFCGRPPAEVTQPEHNGTVMEQNEATQINHNDESAARIADAVTPLIDRLFPAVGQKSSETTIHIISEPGRYFVEEAFCLCCRIYRMSSEHDQANPKRLIRRHYYIAHGCQGVFKDVLLCNETFTPIPLRLSNESANNADGDSAEDLAIPSTVHGPSGESYDIVCSDIFLPEMRIGDWLVFERVGAYTLSIAARSGRPPIRYVVGGTSASS